MPRQTVHTWLLRGVMPPRDWPVNDQEAWLKENIVSWALASGRMKPEEMDEYERRWELLKSEKKILTRRERGAGKPNAPIRLEREHKPAAKPRKATKKVATKAKA